MDVKQRGKEFYCTIEKLLPHEGNP
jgi:hypothetical protein